MVQVAIDIWNKISSEELILDFASSVNDWKSLGKLFLAVQQLKQLFVNHLLNADTAASV